MKAKYLSLMFCLVVRIAWGATPFGDSAIYYTNGTTSVDVPSARGGSWVQNRTTGTSGGFFIGSSGGNAGGSGGIDTAGRSFGIWSPPGSRLEYVRDLSGGLTMSQTLSLDFDNGWIAAGGSVGIELRSRAAGGGRKLQLRFDGGATHYVVSDRDGDRSTSLGFTGSGLHVEITLKGAARYVIRVWQWDVPTVIYSATGIFAGVTSEQVDELVVFSDSAGNGPAYDAFFNNIRVEAAIHDDAADPIYESAWTNGANGGFGWTSGWVLGGWGGHGYFMGSGTANGSQIDVKKDGDSDTVARNSLSGRSWGLYAYGGGVAEAFRSFSPLGVIYPAFELTFDNGWLNAGAVAGFALQSESGLNLMELYFVGGATHYSLSDDLGVRSTGISFTDQGLYIQVSRQMGREFSLNIRKLDGTAATNLFGRFVGKNTDVPVRLRVFYYNPGGGGPPRDLYINSIGAGPRVGPLITYSNVVCTFACGPERVNFSPTIRPGAAPVSAFSSTPASGSIFPIGTSVVSCVVTDQLGNAASCLFDVIANRQDNIPPVFQGLPGPAIVECGTNESPYFVADRGSVTAWDSCDGDRTPWISVVVAREPQPSCPPYKIIRRYMVSDTAGNMASATQVVTVVDTTAPQLIGVPSNAVVTCFPIPAPPVVVATDTCSAAVSVSVTDNYRGIYRPEIRRVWRAVDICGNISAATQIIEVVTCDSDDDGLLDPGVTNVPAPYIQWSVDADGDGYADTESQHGANALDPDSDDDGWDDGLELLSGRSPTNAFGTTGLNTNWFYHNNPDLCGATWERIPGQWQRFLMADYESRSNVLHLLVPHRVAADPNTSIRVDVRYSWTINGTQWFDSWTDAAFLTSTVVSATRPFHGLPTAGSMTVNVYRAAWPMPQEVVSNVIHGYYAPRVRWFSNGTAFATAWLVRTFTDGAAGFGWDDFIFASQARGPDFFRFDYPYESALLRPLNGSFEDVAGANLVGWVEYGREGKLSSAIRHSGQHSYACTEMDGAYQRTVVHPGEELVLSGWLLTPSATNAYDTNCLSGSRGGELAIVYLDAEGRMLDMFQTHITVNDAPDVWTYRSVTSIVPARAFAANVLLRVVGANPTSPPGTVYFDDVQLLPSADSDLDGMPDRWELQWPTYFSILAPTDATLDPDGDGLLNIDEFRSGTSPVLSDTDEDGLSDGWELGVGLSPLNPSDAQRDSDGDGLSAIQEREFGTWSRLTDSDGDGIDDGTEVLDLDTQPLVPDAPSFSTALIINVTSTTARAGSWVPSGTGLCAQSPRGWLEYTLVAPSSDVYRLALRATDCRSAEQSSVYPLRLSVDGTYIGRVALTLDEQSIGEAVTFLPWLPMGAHTLRVEWDNASDARRLNLLSIALQKLDGIDADFDGRKDWVESRLRRLSGADTNFVCSLVSPACVEGRDPFASFWSGNLANPVKSINGRWFASVPLSASVDTSAIFQFQGGAVVSTTTVRWVTTDLLSATETLDIRLGDTLKFGCTPTNAPAGDLSIIVEGPITNVYSADAQEVVLHTFDSAGLYNVKGTFIPSAGAPVMGTLKVRVHTIDFGGSPACWVGTWRNWTCPWIPTNALIESGSDLKISVPSPRSQGETLAAQFYAATPEEHGFIARLQSSGLILGSDIARGFRVGMEAETSIQSIGTCRSGAEIFATPVVCSPLLSDLRFEGNVIIGGVLYRDGTIRKTLYPADFDQTGTHILEFIRAASSRSSFCNTLDVYQGTNLVGRYSHP